MGRIAYEILGMRRCVSSRSNFERDLQRLCTVEKVMISILYLLPMLAPSIARSIDASYNFIFPLSMGSSAFAFMPISTRIARRFFDQDKVKIVTLHSLLTTAYILVVFAFSLRASEVFYSMEFCEASGPSGECMYRMTILVSHLFYESGRLVSRSKGLYRAFAVISQLVGVSLMGVLAGACKMGLISHSLFQQLFFCCGVSSIVVLLVLDSYPSMITVEKDLDTLPLVAAVGNLLVGILGIGMILPSCSLEQ
ncbi:hypothetical protein [Encephalitozoon cuniculi GB-M1]|uniref:Uncharacterized protein n=2 Tax=Encephalitozoon cuniculi TaxID=6035 RepID=Q8SVJ3_ENCCU|nr:uncharacterized protein ECU05_0960 [Encephalitozoon cuniculi GB-M1]KMV66153.1 hypothetical protein M970_050960 [Encephalitozoon cuniculi EcunIII-L]UYI27890.1 hypothetical protein J0A71_08g17790 [Encephalitozoon cuniculi]CAD26616.2 hypothetical protein [Encephalitozoon cuniculi GB-M1]